MDTLYFFIFNNISNYKIKMNLMGVIAFLKSIFKHLKRKSPIWMILSQFKGLFACLRQLI